MKIHITLALFVLCLLSFSVPAQKLFEKPYHKWSRDDAEKVLSQSPWVRTYQSAEGQAAIDKEAMLKEQDNLRITPGGRATDARAQKADLAVAGILVRLHSSIVVREAIVRLQEIAAGYDRMDDQKRAAFDASVKDLIDCPYCRNYYIVTMNKAVDSSHRSVEDGLFQTMTNQQMKGSVWLVNDAGVKAPLAQFIPPKGAGADAVFFFQRRDAEGKELITPESKTFKIQFSGEFFTSANPYAKIIPTSFEFEVKPLVQGEKVAF